MTTDKTTSPNPLPSILSPRPIIKDAVRSALTPNSPSAPPFDPEFVQRLTQHVTEQVLRTLHASSSSSSNVNSPQSPVIQSSPIPFDPSPFSTTASTPETVLPSRPSFPGDPIPSPPPSPVRKRNDPRDKLPAESVNRDAAAAPAAPKTTRVADGIQIEATTTLEKIWQPLFDPTGHPTPRLSQFLRGLARHIVDHYEPCGSLVITPPKMLRFLLETRASAAESDYYPWSTIFGGAMSAASISFMYRKLLCQHHLVQQNLHEPPSIPALTPTGFDNFMTCLIQAHPDAAFKRLSKAAREMPISNADDHRERFPKELSRRMLPARSNKQAEQRLISSLSHETHLISFERGAATMPPPPVQPQRQRISPSDVERDNSPYYPISSQGSNAFDDDDLLPPGMPLERERKPYHAKEGSGKRYDISPSGRHASFDAQSDSRGPSRKASTGRHQSETVDQRSRSQPRLVPQAMGDKMSTGESAPINIPPPNRRHRMSTGAVPPPPPPSFPPHSQAPTNSSGTGNRRRSSPMHRAYSRSEPGDLGLFPSTQYTSNLPSSPRDHYPYEHGEGEFNHPISPYAPCTVPSFTNWNTGRSGPPLGDRRRSGHGSGAPGTDGYGSYTSNGSGYGGASTQY